MVAYGRLKTKENCKLSSLKVVAVAYERWSLTRGSNYSDLTEKFLVFWKSGRSREVVARGGSTVFLFLFFVFRFFFLLLQLFCIGSGREEENYRC